MHGVKKDQDAAFLLQATALRFYLCSKYFGEWVTAAFY